MNEEALDRLFSFFDYIGKEIVKMCIDKYGSDPIKVWNCMKYAIGFFFARVVLGIENLLKEEG